MSEVTLHQGNISAPSIRTAVCGYPGTIWPTLRGFPLPCPQEPPLRPYVIARRRAYGFHPGGNPGVNLKSIYHRCHPILVECVWELTKETIDLPLGCLQGGSTCGLFKKSLCGPLCSLQGPEGDQRLT